MADYLGSYKDHFAVFGAICCGYLALKLWKKIISLGLRATRRLLAVDLTKHGRWAVITGSTDGIGKSYAFQMAEKGMDIVLISRNPDKLNKVANEIRQHCKSSVKVIVADFTKHDIYEKIKQDLSGLDIGILVNNVGMYNPSYPAYHFDLENLEQFSMDIVNVNIVSCVMMTGIVLPDMLERRRGIIINIGSLSGFRPLPFCSIYSATKAFVHFFTEALHLEYSPQGVSFQLVAPNILETNMTRDMKRAAGITRGLFHPLADDFVRNAIQTIGKETVTSGYWPHELLQYVTEMLSDSVVKAHMLDLRNKMDEYLKKQ